jgi:uncharacterized protein YndB with AHSA1/START domain
MDTDKIEKQIVLHARPRTVWRAVSDAKQFGSWFKAKFDAPFEFGASVRGTIVPATVEPEVAIMQEPCGGRPIQIEIEDMYREQLFSFRWHPSVLEGNRNYAAEPMTLVEFWLEPVINGVCLTVTEYGFDRLTAERREQARTAHEGAWEEQLHLIDEYYLSCAEEAAA